MGVNDDGGGYGIDILFSFGRSGSTSTSNSSRYHRPTATFGTGTMSFQLFVDIAFSPLSLPRNVGTLLLLFVFGGASFPIVAEGFTIVVTLGSGIRLLFRRTPTRSRFRSMTIFVSFVRCYAVFVSNRFGFSTAARAAAVGGGASARLLLFVLHH